MGGGKGDKAPDAPDMSDLINAAKESASAWEGIARDQIDWAKGQDDYNRGVFEQVVGMQLPAMQEMYDAARADRQRYETEFVPRQDQVISEAFAYDTPERQEQEAARRQADVRSGFEAQRRNALKELEGYGIDPSQTRFGAMDLGYRAQEAAQQAMAANQARYDVEDRGRQMKYDALGLGAALPGQALEAGQAGARTGESATNQAGNLTRASTGAFSTAAPYATAANRALETAAGVTGQNYDQRMATHQQNAAQSGSMWEGAGSLVGTALGGPVGGAIGDWVGSKIGGQPPPEQGFEDGGYTGDGDMPGPTDTIDAKLAENEFVIPADVVKKKGTEFFDKMLAKYKDGGDYDMKREEIRAAEDEAAGQPARDQVTPQGAVPGYAYGGLVTRQGIPA